MEIKIPDYVKYVLNALNNNGYSSYIVGGCVRDTILGLTPKDWDITTDATPDQVEMIFPDTIPTGKQYGTITVLCHNEEGVFTVEVTTFRADGEYIDGRRPEKVTFGKDIIEDLSRRDLTINAIAYNDLVGLVDPFNGKEDIKNKKIRFVGNTAQRIKEDALRILRAIRFMVKLNFEMDDDTVNIIDNHFRCLDKLSKERIHDELIQILYHIKNDNYKDFIINKLQKTFTTIFETKNLKLFDNMFTNYDYKYKLAIILLDRPLYEVEIWLRKYKFSRDDINTIIALIKICSKVFNYTGAINEGVFIRQLMREYGKDEVFLFYSYYSDGSLIQYALDNLQCPTSVTQLALDGLDLIHMGYKEGKEIGDKLNYLLGCVIINPQLNNREDLEELLKNA